MRRHEQAAAAGRRNLGKRLDHRRLRRSVGGRRAIVERLEPRWALAALTPGNLLVSSAPFDSPPVLMEFAPTGGAPLQTIPISHPSGIATERPRDLVVDANGQVQIFNGTFDPRLTTVDPATETLSHAKFPLWSTGNAVTYGGLTALTDFVFASDMRVRSDSAADRGVVRFSVDNLASGWSRAQDFNIGDLTGNTSTTIPHLTVSGTGDGSFDYYSFVVPTAGAKVTFDIDGADTGGPGSFYSYLRLYDSNNQILATSPLNTPITAGAGGSTSDRDAFLEYTFSQPGAYVIEVGACCIPSGVPIGSSYELHISVPGHSEYLLGGSAQLTDVEPNDTFFTAQNTDSGERFGAAEGDVIDLNVGLDGMLYALMYTGHPTGAGNVINVYDPSTLTRVRTITLPFVHRGIAVDAGGDLFMTFPGVYRYSATGTPLAAFNNPAGGILGDIDIKSEGCFEGVPSDGCLAIASTNGAVILTNPSFTDVDFFQARQGEGATFVAFVTEPLRLPKATADVYRVAEDTVGNTFNVLINDLIDSRGRLVISAVGPTSAGGTATISGGASLRYSPAADFSGVETFTYTVVDGLGGSSTATVTVEVSNINEAPVANPDNYSVAEDSGPTQLDPLANDSTLPDVGEQLQLVAVGAPNGGGTAVINQDGLTVTYTPASDFFGDETFTYEISDGNGGRTTGTVTVNVVGSNDPPTATDDQFAVNPDSANNPLDVLANDSDAPDAGETLTIVSIGTPAHGTAELFGTVVRYTPTAGYRGDDSFTYVIEDSNQTQATATVTISVTEVNAPPTATNDAFSINRNSQNNQLDLLANDSFAPDVGETLRITSVTTPDRGGVVQIVNNGTAVRYTPSLGYEGLEQFQYSISDGNGGTATATVQITVGLFNSTPVPVADAYIVRQNSLDNVLEVLVNDFDPDGDGLTVLSVGATSSGGTVEVAPDSGRLLYSPPQPYLGFETFTYTVTDGLGGTASTLVVVEIRGWQNPADPLDTNGDTFVAPDDSLSLINELNDPTIIADDGRLPLAPDAPVVFYDVNGDGYLSPGDVLLIINALNLASGEAPDFGAAFEPTSTLVSVGVPDESADSLTAVEPWSLAAPVEMRSVEASSASSSSAGSSRPVAGSDAWSAAVVSNDGAEADSGEPSGPEASTDGAGSADLDDELLTLLAIGA